jgi:hypothetical protein
MIEFVSESSLQYIYIDVENIFQCMQQKVLYIRIVSTVYRTGFSKECFTRQKAALSFV